MSGDKSVKATKDPSSPKRGLSPYIFFANEQRDKLRTEQPDLKFGEIGKVLGERWKALSDAQKAPYEKKAATDKNKAAADNTKSSSVKKEWKNPSFVLKQPNEVQYEDRAVPEVADPHDVIVAVKFTGICGSDVHYWTEGRIGPFIVKEPMILGHESSGIVHTVGDAVKDLQKGDKVAMEPGIPCRRCDRCKSGKYNLCSEMAFAATPPFDGTLCKYYRLPSDYCYRLPSHVSLEEGALVEPLSVAVHIVKQADIRPGQSIVIFGCGPVGLLCLAVAKAFSAGEVIAVDVNGDRLRFAERYAATKSLRPGKSEGPEDIAKRICKGSGFENGVDIAIDASGAQICMQTAVHVLRSGGTYVQGGMGKPDITFPMMAMVAKELVVRGSFRYGPGDYSLAVHFLASGKISVKELISKKVAFDGAEEAFKDTKAAKGIKILIKGPED